MSFLDLKNDENYCFRHIYLIFEGIELNKFVQSLQNY